jgi:hypothetical protein
MIAIRLLALLSLIVSAVAASACADVIEIQFRCSGLKCPPGESQRESSCAESGLGEYDSCYVTGYGLCCSTSYQRASGYGECRREASLSLERSELLADAYPGPTKLYLPRKCAGSKGYQLIEIDAQSMVPNLVMHGAVTIGGN